ncbi:response regulator transcription factor [Arcobacter peruensis]|uniref:response regulator transcription factor n=1 Tax=Arcobacter peruensis TaxID=2320140 RepID=UPI000F0902B2|nr:response regulator transcription factor [Arcobacter peruensis]
MIDYVLLEKYSKNISVLLIEDDKIIREEMQELLNDIFNNVKVAVDGKDGLKQYFKYYEENKTYFDLIITDIKMPNMNGIDLTKNIYKENKEQIVLVLSAHNETTYLMELINLGIKQFILKPLEINDFIEIIYKISKEIYSNKSDIEIKEVNEVILNDDLYWDKQLSQLVYKEKNIKLTKKEFLLIELLLLVPEKTCTNEEILNHLWDEDDSIPSINNLKNLISRLKKKIPSINIENIYSFGYRLMIKT